eukprot:COSAG02_NODE_7538_length_2969_cov_18.802091_1_plen_512_part_00
MPGRHTTLLQVLSGALATCSLMVPVEACYSHASCSGDSYCDENHHCYNCDYVRAGYYCDAFDGDCSTCTGSEPDPEPEPEPEPRLPCNVIDRCDGLVSSCNFETGRCNYAGPRTFSVLFFMMMMAMLVCLFLCCCYKGQGRRQQALPHQVQPQPSRAPILRDDGSKEELYRYGLDSVFAILGVAVLGPAVGIIGLRVHIIFLSVCWLTPLVLLALPNVLSYRLICRNEGYRVSRICGKNWRGSWDDVEAVFVYEVIDDDSKFPPTYTQRPAVALRGGSRDTRGYYTPSSDFEFTGSFGDVNWRSKPARACGLPNSRITVERFVDYFADKYGVPKGPPVPAQVPNKTVRIAARKRCPIPMTPLEMRIRQTQMQQLMQMQQQMQMMQVVCPAGCSAGDIITVTTPDATGNCQLLQVQVPEGTAAGATFVMRIPPGVMQADSAETQQLMQMPFVQAEPVVQAHPAIATQPQQQQLLPSSVQDGADVELLSEHAASVGASEDAIDCARDIETART